MLTWQMPVTCNRVAGRQELGKYMMLALLAQAAAKRTGWLYLKESQHVIPGQARLGCRHNNQQGTLGPFGVWHSNDSSFHYLQSTSHGSCILLHELMLLVRELS